MNHKFYISVFVKIIINQMFLISLIINFYIVHNIKMKYFFYLFFNILYSFIKFLLINIFIIFTINYF